MRARAQASSRGWLSQEQQLQLEAKIERNSPAACEIWLVSEKTRKEKEEENSLNQATEKPFLRTSLQGKASLLQASAGVLDYRAQVGLMQVAGVQPGAPGSFRGCV